MTQLGTRSLNGKRHPATDRPSGKKQIHNSRPASCHDVVSIVFSLTNDQISSLHQKQRGDFPTIGRGDTHSRNCIHVLVDRLCLKRSIILSSPQTKKPETATYFFHSASADNGELHFHFSSRSGRLSAKNGVIQLRHRAPPPRPIVVALRDDGERRVRPRRRFQSVPDE